MKTEIIIACLVAAVSSSICAAETVISDPTNTTGGVTLDVATGDDDRNRSGCRK